MPFPTVFGELPKYDRQQFKETGILIESASFTPEQEIRTKKKSSPGNLGVVGQVQIWPGPLAIEMKGTVVPDLDGNITGLAAVSAGQAVTCAHFAAASEGTPAIIRHGYSRDPEKLLLVEGAKTEVGEEEPACTLNLKYYRDVSKNPLELAA